MRNATCVGIQEGPEGPLCLLPILWRSFGYKGAAAWNNILRSIEGFNSMVQMNYFYLDYLIHTFVLSF